MEVKNMNNKNSKGFKAISSLILALTMAFNLLIPVTALADEQTVRTYDYDIFSISYSIVNSWANSQNVIIEVKNTSSEPIENWMLSYDLSGDISDIWNASVETDESENEYVKNAVHNAIIAPDSSVIFGYTLNNASGFPDDFHNDSRKSGQRKRIYS
jgi:hypothetical protein